MEIRRNVVMKRWPFRVTYSDGRVEEITVQAESYHNAIYALPKLGRHGRYEYLGKKGDK